MFDILEMQLKDFKSYRGKHSFTFPTAPGLYSLTGRNPKNKRLGANGIGKTSFIDAICWCLFGVSTRGLRGPEVVNWKEKSCEVCLKLKVGNETLLVHRKQSPNSLMVTGRVVEQEHLNKLLGLNKDAFLHSVILPQFNKAFFERSPSEKLTLFSSIMDLEFWFTKSKEAEAIANKSKDDIAQLETRIAKHTGKIESLREDIKSTIERRDGFSDEAKAKIKKLEAKRPELEKQHKLLTNRLEAAKRDAEGFKAKLDKSTGTEDKLSTKIGKRNRARQELVSEKKVIVSEIKTVNDEMDQVKNLGPICDECKQPVDKKHRKAHTLKLSRKLDELKTSLKVSEERIVNADSEIDTLTDELKDMVSLRRKKRRLYDDAVQLHSSLTYRMVDAKRSLKELDNSIEQERKRKNPFKTLTKEKKDELKSIKSELKGLKTQLSEYVELHEAINFWPSGFKRIRLYIIEEALKGLEIEVNNTLSDLGLVDWEITLDVERENKSGGITKGFSVMIGNPETDKPVRFEAWSGGETQRLSLAGDLGLSNLIMERAGLNNQIEFVDEPSEHLSPEGLADLLETLHSRAEANNKKIWLCDHNVFEFGGFAGILNVIRDESGSHFEYA